MNRREFQRLAEERLEEARTLARGNLYSGAYYLAGLAVECALKACIAKQTRKFDFPDKNKVQESWSHDLEKLFKLAEVEKELKEAVRGEASLADNWALVKDWDVSSRHERVTDVRKAKDLMRAVEGAMEWLRLHW